MRPFDVVLQERGYAVVGVDRTQEGTDCLGTLPYLPFRDEVFSLVLCINVLQYVDDPLQACREMYRTLHADGVIVIVVPFCLPLGPHDYWRWTEYSARKLLNDSGFDDDDAAPILSTMSNELHLLALSARKAVPLIGPAIAAGLDLAALVGLRSRDYRMTGGYALKGTKRK
jgi:ubiquinone/menaquinone biosynthesis C-methylase UbiE